MIWKKFIFFWMLVGLAVSCAGTLPSPENARGVVVGSKILRKWVPAKGLWTREQISEWFIEDTLQKRMAGVVKIGKTEGLLSTTGIMLGVGFVISRDGYILSSDGVIKADTKEVQIFFRDGFKSVGEIVLRDETLGFALIKIRGKKDLFPLHLGDETKLRAGSFCLAAGWETGLVGIVSSVDPVIGKMPLGEFLQTGPIIRNENGGGPLLDVSGGVVGINHSRIEESRGFASPIGPIWNRIRSFVSLESTTRPVPEAVLRTQEALTAAIAKAERSTINIARVRDGDIRSLGSGVVVSPEGYILTNAHIVEGIEGQLFIRSVETGIVPGRVIRKFPVLDLAMVQAEVDHPLDPIVVGNYWELDQGEFLMAIGNPFGLGHIADYGTIRSIVLNPFFPGNKYDFLNTDVPIHPGNSGGPMVNLRGEIVGINIAIRTSHPLRKEGYAVSVTVTREIVDRIIRGEEIDEIQLSGNLSLRSAL